MMIHLVTILLHLLGWVLPLAVLVGVPTFIVVLVIRFWRSDATLPRKIFVIAGSVVTIPVFLVLFLALTSGLQFGGLKLLSRAVGVEEGTRSEAVEQSTP